MLNASQNFAVNAVSRGTVNTHTRLCLAQPMVDEILPRMILSLRRVLPMHACALDVPYALAAYLAVITWHVLIAGLIGVTRAKRFGIRHIVRVSFHHQQQPQPAHALLITQPAEPLLTAVQFFSQRKT